MVGTLLKDLKSTYNDAPDNLKTLFNLKSLEDLIQGPMSDFTGFLNRVRVGVMDSGPITLTTTSTRLPGVPEDRFQRATLQLPQTVA